MIVYSIGFDVGYVLQLQSFHKTKNINYIAAKQRKEKSLVAINPKLSSQDQFLKINDASYCLFSYYITYTNSA